MESNAATKRKEVLLPREWTLNYGNRKEARHIPWFHLYEMQIHRDKVGC